MLLWYNTLIDKKESIMKITKEERQQDINKTEEREHFRQVLNRLKDRCRDPRHKEYSLYGGRGAAFDPKWEDLDDFIDDVDKIPGWDEELFNKHELFLDKDIRIEGNLYYSIDTCLWVTKRVNQVYRPSQLNWFYAYHLEDKQLVLTDSIYLFNILHDGVRGLNGVLRGRKHSTNGWYLWYKDKPVPMDFPVYAWQARGLEKEHENSRTAHDDILYIIDKGLTTIEAVRDYYEVIAKNVVE